MKPRTPSDPNASRTATVLERGLSLFLRSLPVKHGAHRLLDKVRPSAWNRGAPIVSFPYGGRSVEIDISDLVGWHFFMLRSFDLAVTETLLRFAEGNEKDVLWDVGANKGACAFLFASELPTCRIVAIEPQSELQDLLRRNLSVLAPGRHEIFAVGIGEVPGHFDLTIPSDNKGRASLVATGDYGGATIERVRLRTAQEIHDLSAFGWPTLVKIDVEGFELPVLRSLRAPFESGHIRCCVFECHRSQEAAYAEIRRMVEVSGRYRCFAIRKSLFRTTWIPTPRLVKDCTDYAIVRCYVHDGPQGVAERKALAEQWLSAF